MIKKRVQRTEYLKFTHIDCVIIVRFICFLLGHPDDGSIQDAPSTADGDFSVLWFLGKPVAFHSVYSDHAILHSV